MIDKNKVIEVVKDNLKRKSVIFKTGGIRPTNEVGESWIGKVCFELKNEKYPVDKNGNKMIPIATIFLDENLYVPNNLEGIKLITIFMDEKIWNNLVDVDLSKWFHIRMYKNIDEIVACNYTSDKLKAFPLIPELKENEFPMWDDLDDEMIKFINELEDRYQIDYYNDIMEENNANHKIGGYPCSIQGGVGYSDGFEFVLQIASDYKANFNIVDSGNFYFGYSSSLEKWEVRCDFY